METAYISPDLIRGKVEPMIMRCLAEREMYGLEIFDIIRDASGGTYQLKKPTLYSALARLVKKGKIRGRESISDAGVKRVYYTLTPLGREQLQVRKDDWSFSRNVIDTLLYDKFGKNVFRGHEEFVDPNPQVEWQNMEVPENTHIHNRTVITEEVEVETITRAAEIVEEFVENKLAEEEVKEVIEEVVETIAVANGEDEVKELENPPAATPAPSDSAMTAGTGAASYVTQYFISGDYIAGGNFASHSNRHDIRTNPIVGTSRETIDGAFDLPLSAGAQPQPELKPFILNEEARQAAAQATPTIELFKSIVTEDEGPQVVENDGQFQRYHSPNEYIVWRQPNSTMYGFQDVMNQTQHHQHHHPAPEPETVVNADDIVIKPFTRQETAPEDPSRFFVLYNRLKAVVSPLVTLAVVLGLLMTWSLLSGTYQSGADTAFLIGYVTIAVYLLVNLAIFAVYPQLKKLNGNYRREILIRAGISVSIILIALGVNIVAGMTGADTSSYLVFFLVPSIVGLGVILEGLGIYALQRKRFFAA
ncbi:MAG: helix-turn-helix transcriptional regulator [Firmicutes bacterium]|nr:helix-turn-helix transcriptional regulator [Bacillota bacterium]